MKRAARRETQDRKRRTAQREPMEEGIRKKRRNWKLMSNEEIIEYAKKFMKQQGVNGRIKLLKTDYGLYIILLKRKLLDKVGFELKRRKLRSMSDDEVVDYAEKIIIERGIRGRKILSRADPQLYKILRERKLINRVFAGIEQEKRRQRQRHWWMSCRFTPDEIKEIIRKRNELMDEGLTDNSISIEIAREWGFKSTKFIRIIGKLVSSEDLQKNPNLHRKFNPKEIKAIKQRRSELITEALNDGAISAIIGKEMGEKARSIDHQIRKLVRCGEIPENPFKLKRLSGQEIDSIIQKRNALMAQGMSDNAIAKKIHEEFEICKAHVCNLFRRLVKGGKLDQNPNNRKSKTSRIIGFFKGMSDDELVECARGLIAKKGLEMISELQKLDPNLYLHLRKKDLLDKIGLVTKKRPAGFFTKMTDDELVEYAQGFMKEKGITEKTELARNVGGGAGLYDILLRRKLLKRLKFKEIRRKWVHVSDDEIVKLAKDLVHKKGLKNKKMLVKEDCGLHRILCKRNLIDQVFAEIEQSKQQALEREIREGLSQAAEAMRAFGEQR